MRSMADENRLSKLKKVRPVETLSKFTAFRLKKLRSLVYAYSIIWLLDMSALKLSTTSNYLILNGERFLYVPLVNILMIVT